MPTNEEKEKRKIRYEDLAPSLQARIGNLTNKNQLKDLEDSVDRLTAAAMDIRITEAFTKPTDPQDMKELHVDQNYPLPQAYSGGKWEAITMVPDGKGDGSIANTLTIIQSAHQTITVTIGSNQYTSTVQNVAYGSEFSCTVAPEDGYYAGMLNIYQGIVYGDVVIYASEATPR